MTNTYAVDGAEIPYKLELIEKIDPDLVGHATLFIRKGNAIVTGTMAGNIREKLIADYRMRGGGVLPELIMYSGSKKAA
jgi:hypothetical protein